MSAERRAGEQQPLLGDSSGHTSWQAINQAGVYSSLWKTVVQRALFWLPVTCILIRTFLWQAPAMHSRSFVNIKKQAGFNSPPQTILVSIDGFCFKYLFRRRVLRDNIRSRIRYIAPTLARFASEGAFATQGMHPIMPTITFPNHWAIATGLYAENSGIVANVMYDPRRGKWFRYGDDDPSWWQGEPIWQTLRRHARNSSGGPPRNYTTATVFWPGSTVSTHLPSAYWQYNHSVPYDSRVDRAVSLLHGTASELNGTRADFVTLYFEGVDSAGHEFGPNSREVDREIEKADAAIARLFRLLGPNFEQRYNVIIVSDHGMAEVSPDRTIDMNGIIPPRHAQDVIVSPIGMYFNVSASAADVYNIMDRNLQRYKPHAKAYRRRDLPESWHLSKGRTVPPIVTAASIGWGFKYSHQTFVSGARQSTSSPRRARNEAVHGEHGYDNRYAEMRALFIAAGPSFRASSRIWQLEAVDIYPMLCEIFGVTPAPNNGSLARFEEILTTHTQ